GTVRTGCDDVRWTTDARATDRYDFLDQPELGEVADECSDGGAAQLKAVGQLGARQGPVAVHVVEHQRQVVLPDLVGADRSRRTPRRHAEVTTPELAAERPHRCRPPGAARRR